MAFINHFQGKHLGKKLTVPFFYGQITRPDPYFDLAPYNKFKHNRVLYSNTATQFNNQFLDYYHWNGRIDTVLLSVATAYIDLDSLVTYLHLDVYIKKIIASLFFIFCL